MEEYKEHGLEFRHHDAQISAANRLMLPSSDYWFIGIVWRSAQVFGGGI